MSATIVSPKLGQGGLGLGLTQPDQVGHLDGCRALRDDDENRVTELDLAVGHGVGANHEVPGHLVGILVLNPHQQPERPGVGPLRPAR